MVSLQLRLTTFFAGNDESVEVLLCCWLPQRWHTPAVGSIENNDITGTFQDCPSSLLPDPDPSRPTATDFTPQDAFSPSRHTTATFPFQWPAPSLFSSISCNLPSIDYPVTTITTSTVKQASLHHSRITHLIAIHNTISSELKLRVLLCVGHWRFTHLRHSALVRRKENYKYEVVIMTWTTAK